jgi:TolB-like protein/Tfp pilus assembly protein PilF
MDVLVMLAQHAGQVVLRTDLLAQLWPDTVVTDEVLSRCIYELRRQLCQAGGGERYREMIDTVPKRGYRLTGEITLIRPHAGDRRAVGSRWWLFAAAIAIGAAIVLAVVVNQRNTKSPAVSQSPSATAKEVSIAVLPFVDMSEGQNQGYLSDGISEEILNRLAQSGELPVISRTSSFSFRDRPLDIPEIAAKLDVSHVLEGSVRRAGDNIRITVQLIAASSDSHVWSATYDRAVGDLFAVQDEIAAAVTAALQVKLAEDTRHRPMPVNMEAHERFLQGEYFYNRRAPGDLERAAKYYESAVTIDPRYARVWAALAGAYSNLAWNGPTPDKALQRRQGEAALRAVELDPRLAVAQLRLSQFYSETSDSKKSEEHRRLAIALDPDDPLVLGITASEASLRGDTDRALAMQRRAAALDPLNTAQRQNLAVQLMASGQLDEAMSEYRRVLELNPAAGLDIEIEFVRILVLQRRYGEARSAVEKMPAGKYRDHGLALLYQTPGHPAEADAALRRLAAHPREIMDIVRLAEVYAFRGLHKEAFAALQGKKDALKLDRDSGTSWIRSLQIEARVSPFLKPLHSDPRWTALMAEPG